MHPQHAKGATALSMDDASAAISIRAGTLEVRLAQSFAEVEAAQALRYRIFCDEMGAHPTPEMAAVKRDFDEFDQWCDHLLVLEHASGKPQVVGTYRMLRRSSLPAGQAFYTQGEFSIEPLLKITGDLLELGRSCVDERYRSRAVLQLLWRGIGQYVVVNQIELLLGCASFAGIDLDQHAESLSYLYHYHLAPEAIRVRALPERFVEMNRLPKEAFNGRAAFAALPPLIKGYLRAGAFIGDGAVVDAPYNTTDVGIVLRTDSLTEKYFRRYTSPNEPAASTDDDA